MREVEDRTGGRKRMEERTQYILCMCTLLYSFLSSHLQPNSPSLHPFTHPAMLQASLLEPATPSPQLNQHPKLNGHKPVTSTSSRPLAPPIPPRTYSQRPPMANGTPPAQPASLAQSQAHPPPIKRFTLIDFQFVKLLGKGSFGKVRNM